MRLLCNIYTNCPICGRICEVDEVDGWKTSVRLSGTCKVFCCYNPVITDPLHYYSHTIDKSTPDVIAYQEFSINLGMKSILFATNFLQQKSFIKSDKNVDPLELNFIIVPDFPHLESLKKKIKTAITFG